MINHRKSSGRQRHPHLDQPVSLSNERYAKPMNVPAIHSLADLLSPDVRVAWRRIETDTRDVFGRSRSVSAVVLRHVEVFETLIDGGLRHQDLVALLTEAGLKRADGNQISAGAVAAAISRARRSESPRRLSALRLENVHVDPRHFAARPAASSNPRAAGPDPPESVKTRSELQKQPSVISRGPASANMRAAQLLNDLGDQDD